MEIKKRFFSILLLALFAACGKYAAFPEETQEDAVRDEIVFCATDTDREMNVSTKTSVVTSLSSFYAAATKGTAGSETSKWTSYQFNSDGAGTPTYHGTGAGKWWPDTDESYHFYASNNALTFAAAGTTVSATNSTDVICAYMPSPTYKTKNTLTFEHIFARIGDVTVSAASGYTISNVSISITPKTGGTYNIRTGSGQTNDTGWSSLTTGSATGIANSTPGTKSNDVWLVPGNYTLTASWRAVRDDYTHDYSNVSASAVIAVQKGKVNAINITLGGNATEITYGVSINAWGSAALAAAFPTATPPTANGVYIKYTDGSYSDYNVLESGKTPLGVALKKNECSFCIHPTQGEGKQWSTNTSTTISGVTTTTSSTTAIADYSGKDNTAAVVASGLAGSAFTFATDIGTNWWLPSCGEMYQIKSYYTLVNTAMALIGGTNVDFSLAYWTSTQRGNSWSWYWECKDDEFAGGPKTSYKYCRAVTDF